MLYDGTEDLDKWASQIKSILQQYGFEYVWNNQFNIEVPFSDIRQKNFDIYLQKWYSDINNSNRLQSYCIYEHDFKLEHYITDVTENKYRTALARFRTSSHNLFIETGRYDNTPLHERIYKSCKMNKIEDEFHFLLTCPTYRELRIKYSSAFRENRCPPPPNMQTNTFRLKSGGLSLAVTLKSRSRSTKPIQLFIMSRCYIHANWLKSASWFKRYCAHKHLLAQIWQFMFHSDLEK